MRVRETSLPGVLVVEPKVFRDERGFFTETFNTRRLAGSGIPEVFVQDNHSRSTRGVLRGLHYQLESSAGQARPRGERTDLRRGGGHSRGVADISGNGWASSSTMRTSTHCGSRPGFAHGFCVLSDVADVIYKCTTLYDACGRPRSTLERPANRDRVARTQIL